MRAIVTGGAGFIGSHLVDALIKRGDEVIVIDNLSTGKRENINPAAIFFERDIVDYWQTKSVFKKGADCVFHLAALPKVSYAMHYPFLTERVNFSGTLNILRLCAQFGISRLIYSSSSSVYGSQTKYPVTESMNVYPMSFYAIQKFAAENYCRLLSGTYLASQRYLQFSGGIKGKFPLTISLRYFNVYGLRQDAESSYSAVIPIFFKNAAENRESIIYGNGEQRRDFTHVADVASANILAFESNEISKQVGQGEVINIGCGKNYSIKQVAKMIGTKYVYGPARVGEPRISLADITKAKELLGWEPKSSLTEGIAELKRMHNIV